MYLRGIVSGGYHAILKDFARIFEVRRSDSKVIRGQQILQVGNERSSSCERHVLFLLLATLPPLCSSKSNRRCLNQPLPLNQGLINYGLQPNLACCLFLYGS